MTELASALSLELSDDETVASLVVSPGVKPSDCDRAVVGAFLSEHEIQIRSEAHAAIDALLEAVAASPDDTHKVVVARGAPPQHGQNGRIEWAEGFDPSAEPPAAEPEADPKAGHYERTAFTLAKEGDIVAILIPPTDGIDGVTVRGKTIAAKTGKPAPVKFDDSIRQGDGGELIAANPGAVSFKAGLLRIVSHLEIDEFVDFSTGNIHFDGDVTVHKGVRDCFVVQATKDIHIRGMVEAAEISAGRDARLDGGVAARDKGSVIVERDLAARYLDSAFVVVGRNLSVEKEIVSSDLTVGGQFLSPSGSVIGGSAAIGGVCELAEAGSPSGAETVISLGCMRDFDALGARLGALRTSIDALYEKTKAAHDQLVALAVKLTASQAEQMTELQFSLQTLEAMKQRTTAAGDKITSVVAAHTDAELTVHRLVHQNVVIRIGDYTATFKDPFKGPLRITLGANGRPTITDLITESARDLSEIARVVETENAAKAAAGARAA